MTLALSSFVLHFSRFHLHTSIDRDDGPLSAVLAVLAALAALSALSALSARSARSARSTLPTLAS